MYLENKNIRRSNSYYNVNTSTPKHALKKQQHAERTAFQMIFSFLYSSVYTFTAVTSEQHSSQQQRCRAPVSMSTKVNLHCIHLLSHKTNTFEKHLLLSIHSPLPMVLYSKPDKDSPSTVVRQATSCK